MATGADIPPELFRRILRDVCEDAGELLNLRRPVQNRKEAVKNITACSLTCVYWARFCRRELFGSVWIKNCEDMRTFLSLVSNTPTKFAPISEYIFYATLVQRVGDRLWLHLIRMQPSLFQFWRLRRRRHHVSIYFCIENSPNDATSLQSSTSHRLFASLPRTLPSSCLQCNTLTIDKLHFVTPHDLTSLLQRFSFSGYGTLRLTNVAWSAQADFARDLLAGDLLLISPFYKLEVEVHRSAYTAETAWLAFSTTLRGLSTQGSTVTSTSEYDAYDEQEHRPTLEVLSSVQRAVLDICKAFCSVSSLNYASFSTRRTAAASRGENTRAYLHRICTAKIQEREPTGNKFRTVSEIQLVFYGTQAVIPVTNGSGSIVIDSISELCASIYSTEKFTTAGNVLPTHLLCPWAEIVGLCAAQIGFMRLQLDFDSRDHLVQFMEAQRAALGKLDNRVALFYTAHWHSRAADFQTLADIGYADEYGYIDQSGFL